MFYKITKYSNDKAHENNGRRTGYQHIDEKIKTQIKFGLNAKKLTHPKAKFGLKHRRCYKMGENRK